MYCTGIGGPDDPGTAVELADVLAPSSLLQPLTANAASEPRKVRRPICGFLNGIISRLLSEGEWALTVPRVPLALSDPQRDPQQAAPD